MAFLLILLLLLLVNLAHSDTVYEISRSLLELRILALEGRIHRGS